MSISFSTKLQGRWADVTDRFFERWNIAMDEAQLRTYTADKMMSDSLVTWSDLAGAWFLPYEMILNRDLAKYEAPFKVTKASPKQVLEIRVPDRGATFNLQVSSLDNPTHGALKVGTATAKFTNNWSVEVTLEDFSDASNKPGRYTGEVLRKDPPNTPVARVIVDLGG